MTSIGLTAQEFWVSIFAISVVGLFYFVRDMLDEVREEEDQTPWRWGDKARRKRAPAAWWASHLTLAPLTLFATVFAIGLLRRL